MNSNANRVTHAKFEPAILSAMILGATILFLSLSPRGYAQERGLPEPVFLASYDGETDAVTAEGRLAIVTAESLKRQNLRAGNHHDDVRLESGGGKYGGCLRFQRKGEQVLLYPAAELPLFKPNAAVSISFWLRLNPDEDLEPGFCDPLQITAKSWNDGAIWVDFDNELPRAFRMGAFPDYRVWNPEDVPWDNLAEQSRPLIPIPQPPFDRNRWTHVVMTIEGVNSSDNQLGTARLYLDGKLHGQLQREFRIGWTPEQTVLMIGIAYVGDFDELAIFDSALSAEQIQRILKSPKGLGGRAIGP